MFMGRPARPSLRDLYVPATAFTAFLMVFIVATRLALAPRYLYYFDSANFALSLEKFDPAMHQPQPPGYPLFVLLIRILHFWIASPERVLVVAGLLAACAATMLVFALANDLGGRTAGILAAALLASDPVFWFAGITNQIRLFLAVGALAVSLLAWRALRHGGRWFYAAFAGLGVAAGFRPEIAVLLFPLLVLVWYRTGRGLARLALGVALLAATALPWMVAIVIAVGGPARLFPVLWNYSVNQFGPTSLAFGAEAVPARHMFWEAVVWNSLGALAWMWAIPFLRGRWMPQHRDTTLFLAVAAVPAFLFSAFIHIGDPDQALASISILTAAGGLVCAAFFRQASTQRVLLAAVVLMSLHVLTFFEPPGKVARAASYRAAAAVDRMTASAINGITALSGNGPVTIVDYGSSVASRQLSFYFPDAYVVVLPSGTGPAEAYYHHAPLARPGDQAVILPGSRRVLCLLPWNATAATLPGWHHSGAVYYRDRVPGSPVRVGPYTLIPDRP